MSSPRISLSSRVTAALLLLTPLSWGRDKFLVHEWGTFTSLQDEAGRTIGGINTDDEPVPLFVHRLPGFTLTPNSPLPTFIGFKGLPACRQDVTMRLETPVLYFYLPEGQATMGVDVKVGFRGGWLTEYYPYAESFLKEGQPLTANVSHVPIDAKGTGVLRWRHLLVGGSGKMQETADPVWLAPRKVAAATVQLGAEDNLHPEQTERFLFYRGVGHVDPPLQVIRQQGALQIFDRRAQKGRKDLPGVRPIPGSWLVSVRDDGQCAFRSVGALPSDGLRGSTPADFADSDYSPVNLARLKQAMHVGLVTDGLFEDEADALLNTWEVSYFKSPGLRLFYLCPKEEIESVLPLEVSVPADIHRVMVGRIELVTPQARGLLKQIAAGPAVDITRLVMEATTTPEKREAYASVASGRAPLSALLSPVPPLYGAYLRLGRFRQALVLDEQERRPAPALQQFILMNGLSSSPTGQTPKSARVSPPAANQQSQTLPMRVVTK